MNKAVFLIPSYNDQDQLILTLKSLDLDDCRADIVIVDDGSSPAIQLSESFKNNIILLKLDKNKGIVGALNFGLEYILSKKYEYILRIDAGDISINNRVKNQIEFMDTHLDLVMSGGQCVMKDEDGNFLFNYYYPVGFKKLKKKLHINSCISHPSLIIRASLFKNFNFYSPHYPAAEDYEIFLRASQDYCIDNMNLFITEKQISKNSISFKKRRTQIFSRMRLQIKYFNFFILESYIGILKSVFVFILPASIIEMIKNIKKENSI